MKIEDLLERYQWIQIPNSTGRFTLSPDEAPLSIQQLIDSEEMEIKQYPSANPDEMLHVVTLEDGGLISYERQNATFLHTLNSENMFKRKQWELGIISYSPRSMPEKSE